jgi:hypothetical protein
MIAESASLKATLIFLILHILFPTSHALGQGLPDPVQTLIRNSTWNVTVQTGEHVDKEYKAYVFKDYNKITTNNLILIKDSNEKILCDWRGDASHPYRITIRIINRMENTDIMFQYVGKKIGDNKLEFQECSINPEPFVQTITFYQ